MRQTLREDVGKARERFGKGDFIVENRIKKCRTYPVYRLAREELGTELLRGEKKVSPGEYIEKVCQAIREGKIGSVVVECVEGWRGSAGPFTPRPEVSSPVHKKPEYWGWFEQGRSPSATSGRGYWNL